MMELPNYRLPGAKNVAQLLGRRQRISCRRRFSVILVATVVVWFLQSFNLRLNMVTDSADSILAAVSSLLVPVFAPLGLGDWRIAPLCSVVLWQRKALIYWAFFWRQHRFRVITGFCGVRFWCSVCCIRRVWQQWHPSGGSLAQNGQWRGVLAVRCSVDRCDAGAAGYIVTKTV